MLVAAPAEEEVRPRQVVGDKRKAPHDVEAVASVGEEDEVFDNEGKLLRTVFVENLPLRTKKKALTKEFTTFGVVDSVRIRLVPLGDVEVNNAPPLRRLVAAKPSAGRRRLPSGLLHTQFVSRLFLASFFCLNLRAFSSPCRRSNLRSGCLEGQPQTPDPAKAASPSSPSSPSTGSR
ncbi:hypothetical protein ZWY2020_025836 [Hordeum vulgare]|nr:hypothetical protein ZWY2020_025836 [Hordeum vulgare]